MTEQATENYVGPFYCVRCKESRDGTGAITAAANGRLMAKGNCPVCDTKVTRFLPTPKS